MLHYDDVEEHDQSWFGPVPVTSPLRTLNDCSNKDFPPELLREATLDALARGLVTRDEVAGVEAALNRFGGLSL